MAELITVGMTGAQYRANINGIATPYTFNIRSYGAIGDGTTNDTEAIQNAIDACVAAGGGTLYIPEGTYLTNTLNTTAAVTIMGDGSISILKSAAAEPLLQCVNAVSGGYQFYLNINNVFLEGNDIGTIGLTLKRVMRFNLRNVQIQNFVQYGVYAEGLLIGRFEALFVNKCVVGFFNKKSVESPGLDPNQVVFSDCIFIYNTKYGIEYYTGYNVKLIGCTLEWNGTSGNAATGAIYYATGLAYSSHYGRGLVLDGCWFEYNEGIVIKTVNLDDTAGMINSISNSFFIVNTAIVTINVLSDTGANKLILRDTAIQDTAAIQLDGAAAVLVNDQSYIGGTITQNDASKYYTVDVTEVT